MVPYVHEQQVTVVAFAVHPSRQADRLADIGSAELSAVMGAIGVHDQVGSLRRNLAGNRALRFRAANIFVNPAGPG